MIKLDSVEVQRFLPHRPPFLFVDQILEIQTGPEAGEIIGTTSRGTRHFPREESFFRGHFPNYPIVPGVILIEAMAQVAAFCLYPPEQAEPEAFKKKYRFILAGVPAARFRKPVFPGDTVEFRATLQKAKATVRVFQCEALVGGERAAEAEILATMTPVPQTDQTDQKVQKATTSERRF